MNNVVQIGATVAHETANGLYRVQVIEGATEEGENYAVVNTKYNKTEFVDASLPQVISVAEQFDYMMTNNTWEQALLRMFGPPVNPFAGMVMGDSQENPSH